jgi:hypothetical protein
VGPPDSPVVHRTGTVHCPVHLLAPALTSARAVRTVYCYCTLLQSIVGAVAVAPLAHRTVRCYTGQSDELLRSDNSRNPKVASSELISLVHRTLSGGTPDSPVRQTRAAFGFLCFFHLNSFF